jgi:hypothetical protein
VVLVGWSLLAGLVRPVPVVMAGVRAQDRPQVPFAVDEHPVGALGSCAAYPSLGETVRARGPRGDFDNLDALAGEDRVEGAGEFGVAVPDQEAEGADPVAEIHDQVAGLLGGPRTVRVSGHAEDVHVPGPHLHDEQHSVECSFVAFHRILVTWESSQVRTAFGRQRLPRSDST